LISTCNENKEQEAATPCTVEHGRSKTQLTGVGGSQTLPATAFRSIALVHHFRGRISDVQIFHLLKDYQNKLPFRYFHNIILYQRGSYCDTRDAVQDKRRKSFSLKPTRPGNAEINGSYDELQSKVVSSFLCQSIMLQAILVSGRPKSYFQTLRQGRPS
jgi:hypothetical protein